MSGNGLTVTVEVAVLALPAASLAVQVTDVTPIGYWTGPLLVKLVTATLSVAVTPARKATMAVSVEGVPVASTAGTTTGVGAVTIGLD